MLRAKHLGTLSQSARSFFLSGTRCSAADGSSCTCSEDETCISRRPLRANVQNLQAPSLLLSKASVGVGSLTLVDSEKVNAKKPENSSLSQEITTSRSLDRAVSVSYADDFDAKDIAHPSPPIADQFVKAGMAAVGLLSDLVNYRIPMTDGSAMVTSLQNSMVDPTKPISNVRSANMKTSRKDKVYDKPSAEPVSRSSSTSISCVKKSLVMGKGQFHKDQRAYSDRFIPNTQQSEGKLNGNKSAGFTRDIRHTKVIGGAAPVARQFLSSSHVESVSRILHQSKWSPATEEALGKLNCLLDAFQANQILKQLQDYTVALGFFYWLKRQPGFKHDGHTYTTMVGILGRARQFGAINKLLDQMVNDGCQPNIVTYNRLIHSYGRANYLNEAIGVFNQMQKVGCEPDRVTYCTLIDIHAKAGYLDVAIDMYQRMQEAGLSPDTFTYSVIINCLGKAGHLAAAHKLFCEMVDQGCRPNLVTYNIMIALHAKARNYQSSLQLYRDMQGAGFEPDKVTYSIVMEVLGHCGYLDEAEAVFTEMKRKNWVPDEPVYGLLVDLWGKAGNVEKAWECIKPCLVRVYAQMFQLTYTLLLSCCTEAQTSFDMTFCCELMTITGHPAHTFLLSMPTPGPDGQNVRETHGTAVTALSRTLAWFRREMLASGICPTRIDIVTGWGRRSRVTGTSLVRQAVQELLNMFRFPFFTENGNSGCFVGCGEPLSRWLLQSYVERMHLL
ncbi:Pentatricopeptide repeat-containing protein [Sesamum angolense]|uniref:Pentatricopeptide repeat-containing protein n=1 Tax=Sesamum angolense TaxID=2727404 RepID=A0AAE2BQX9_9LAMI|nr:Pentatricopeptide repeat-containing protein [Sesamum angolense]